MRFLEHVQRIVDRPDRRVFNRYNAKISHAAFHFRKHALDCAQRQRLHVVLDELPEGLLPTGAKATVQLYPGDGLSHLLGRAQIVAISLLHYVY